MNKYIQKIKQSFGYAGALSHSHPVTFTILILDTIALTLLSFCEGLFRHIWSSGSVRDDLERLFGHLSLWLFMLLFAVFLMESILGKERIILKTVIVSASALVTFFHSALISGTLLLRDEFKAMARELGDDRLILFTVGYFSVISLLAVFFCYRKLESDFSLAEYLLGVLSGGFLVSVIYCVVTIGALTLTFVFTELLFGDFEDIFLPMFAIISGLYYGSAVIYVISNSEKEVPRFVDILFRYVLYGMSLAAYVIVYLYIFKVTVLSKFPSNSVYGILTALFCFSIPLAYLNCYKEEGFIGRISRILPYIFAPLLILQSYTIIVRINQYGLTDSRYLGIVFICIEAMYIIWYAVKKESLKNLFVVLAVICFILTLVPGTNVYAVPRFAQTRTFEKLIKWDEDDLSQKQVKRLLAAYDYLRRNDKGKVYLEQNYSADELEIIKDLGVKTDGNYHGVSEYVDYRCHSAKLDVSGYDSFYTVGISMYRGDNEENIDLENIELQVRELGSSYTVSNEDNVTFNAVKLVKLLKSDEYSGNEYKYGEEPLIYEQSGRCFVITGASLSYDKITDDVYSLSLNGYLLE